VCALGAVWRVTAVALIKKHGKTSSKKRIDYLCVIRGASGNKELNDFIKIVSAKANIC
jgi:hypothetical protein